MFGFPLAKENTIVIIVIRLMKLENTGLAETAIQYW